MDELYNEWNKLKVMISNAQTDMPSKEVDTLREQVGVVDEALNAVYESAADLGLLEEDIDSDFADEEFEDE